MKLIADIAKANRSRVIFMSEPSIYQPNLPQEIEDKLWMGFIDTHKINVSNEFLFREMRRFNKALGELSQSEGIEWIDLEKEIPKDLTHFYDDVHYTPAGAKHVAEIITAYLLNHPGKFNFGT